MAHIKTGSLISEIAGSVGGLTFTRSPTGQIVRTRTAPKQPHQRYTKTAAGNFAYLQRYWSLSLTPAQRDKWELWANRQTITNKLGEPTPRTGLQAWHKTNRPLMDCGAALVLTPPTTLITDTLFPYDGTLTNDASNHINSIRDTFRSIPSANPYIQLYATPPRPNKTSLNRVRAVLLNPTSPWNIQRAHQCATFYNTRLNTPYAPDAWFIRFEAYIIDYATGAQGNRVTNILAIA